MDTPDTIYAEVIIDITAGELDRSFDYRVPEELVGTLRPGMVVQVPFGKGNRIKKGYCISLSGESHCEEDKIKEILGLATEEETTEGRLVDMASWMKETYGSTMIQALKTVLPIREKVSRQQKRYIVLSGTREEARALLQELSGNRCKARRRLLEAVLQSEDGHISCSEAVKELGAGRKMLEFFEERGILKIQEEENLRNPLSTEQQGIQTEERKELTSGQKKTVQEILSEWGKPSPRPVLIHGVTGSGKTEVYMELIRHVIEEGKQAIVLIPEISLTYQTVSRFCRQFGDRVSVQNSRLSPGERYDQFLRARRGEISVMVGPRSALFTPFENLGLIVMDEEHETAYKSEHSPRYHARDVAIHLAGREGAHVVLGSATPSLESFTKALEGEYLLTELPARYEGRELPVVSVVDLRRELKNGNRSILSRELGKEMEDRLIKGEQTMLFLNRRGYAGFVSCRSCGEVMECPHCAVSLSEHQGGRLVCHYCGYETAKPLKCPQCGSAYIGGFKAGTQQVQQVVGKMFPKARILRMDSDTTRNKGSYESILSAFARREADILIGTQMIVKGHDFPGVTLVGVIAADLSLKDSDYRSAERTYQLLTQAAGRAGRGERQGKAVFQTYHPEHYSIRTAAAQDYAGFYREEISFRRMMDYPPAAHMMAVLASCREEERLSLAMEYLALYVRKLSRDGQTVIIGPAPAAVSKIKDIYHQVLYLKNKDMKVLSALRRNLDRYVEINSGFRGIYIQYDMQ